MSPTFQMERASSIIHISLSKGVDVASWEVVTEYNACDHHTICFKIKTADWPKVTECLTKAKFSVPERITHKKIDKMASFLYTRLEEALDIACPTRVAKERFKGHNWSSEKLLYKQSKVKRQYDIARRIVSDDEWDKYKKMQKTFRKGCRQAKTASWRHFVSETENENKMSFFV